MIALCWETEAAVFYRSKLQPTVNVKKNNYNIVTTFYDLHPFHSEFFPCVMQQHPLVTKQDDVKAWNAPPWGNRGGDLTPLKLPAANQLPTFPSTPGRTSQNVTHTSSRPTVSAEDNYWQI